MKDNLENNRILKFFPADKNNLNILSSKQIDNFNLKGYISPLNVFSYEEITSISEYFDELISKARKKGHDDYAINGRHRYCSGIYNIMMNLLSGAIFYFSSKGRRSIGKNPHHTVP